jgi:hypothetical protein
MYSSTAMPGLEFTQDCQCHVGKIETLESRDCSFFLDFFTSPHLKVRMSGHPVGPQLWWPIFFCQIWVKTTPALVLRLVAWLGPWEVPCPFCQDDFRWSHGIEIFTDFQFALYVQLSISLNILPLWVSEDDLNAFKNCPRKLLLPKCFQALFTIIRVFLGPVRWHRSVTSLCPLTMYLGIPCSRREPSSVFSFIMQALLVVFKPSSLFELDVFSTWKRTRYLGHMTNRQKKKFSGDHIGTVAVSSQTPVFPTVSTTDGSGWRTQERGVHALSHQ